VSIAGESGPARRDELSPDHEKWGSCGAGEVSADSGGRAVFSSRPPGGDGLVGSNFAAVVVVTVVAFPAPSPRSPPPFLPRIPSPSSSSEFDLPPVRIELDDLENDCSNGLGSSSNFDFEMDGMGGRMGGRWRTCGGGAGAGAALAEADLCLAFTADAATAPESSIDDLADLDDGTALTMTDSTSTSDFATTAGDLRLSTSTSTLPNLSLTTDLGETVPRPPLPLRSTPPAAPTST
jgi:hypothetical protein